MNTKEYIVALEKDIDYNSFWHEIESKTVGLPHIPDRAVRIANNRDMFKRICEYWLTDEEAELVKNDPRVLAVEIPVRNNPDIEIGNNSTQNIAGMNYTKQAGNIQINYITGVSTGAPPNYTPTLNASINWGLIRHSFQKNPYGPNNGSTNSSTNQYYNYVLNGSNVDIIINDSGIQTDHPEFTGRIINVDWNNIAAAVGAYPFNWNYLSYHDTNGHGTNVAGIAAGTTYGWAKGSNIIPLYLLPSGQSAADPLDMFSMMIYWHQNKGTNNPTIVNMSWDLRYTSRLEYNDIAGGVYQNNTILPFQQYQYYQVRGLIAWSGNGTPFQGQFPPLPYSSNAYNAALSEVIDAGIIVCQAAANNGFKIDVLGGADYNNYVLIPKVSNNPLFYQRGASPTDPRTIVVGALDTKTSSTAQDQRAEFSCAGPGVDIWAAGTYIMSAGPNVSVDPMAPYYLNNSFNELNLSGTSQATPQVTGMASLYLQANPFANIYNPNNCSIVKSWLTSNATTNTFYSPGNATSYTNSLSLLGGAPRVAYQALQGITKIKTDTTTWNFVKNAYVKIDTSTWAPIKTSWTKTSSGWVHTS